MFDAQQIIQMLSSLAGIIAIIIIATFLLKKFTHLNNKSNDDLSIISTLSLGTKEKLVLVQVADQQILLGVTHQAIQTLHILPEPIQRLKATTTKRQEATA